VELLTEIWSDYHQETLCRPIPRRLPEPPDQRQMLKAEIKFFVQSIQEKAKAHGRFVEFLVKNYRCNFFAHHILSWRQDIHCFTALYCCLRFYFINY